MLETHAHADHLSAAPYVKRQTGAKIGIGEHIGDVQTIFRPVFNATDVSGAGQRLRSLFRMARNSRMASSRAGAVRAGHTPAVWPTGRRRGVRGRHAVHARLGTARCDFPAVSAHALGLIRRLLALRPRRGS